MNNQNSLDAKAYIRETQTLWREFKAAFKKEECEEILYRYHACLQSFTQAKDEASFHLALDFKNQDKAEHWQTLDAMEDLIQYIDIHMKALVSEKKRKLSKKSAWLSSLYPSLTEELLYLDTLVMHLEDKQSALSKWIFGKQNPIHEGLLERFSLGEKGNKKAEHFLPDLERKQEGVEKEQELVEPEVELENTSSLSSRKAQSKQLQKLLYRDKMLLKHYQNFLLEKKKETLISQKKIKGENVSFLKYEQRKLGFDEGNNLSSEGDQGFSSLILDLIQTRQALLKEQNLYLKQEEPTISHQKMQARREGWVDTPAHLALRHLDQSLVGGEELDLFLDNLLPWCFETLGRLLKSLLDRLEKELFEEEKDKSHLLWKSSLANFTQFKGPSKLLFLRTLLDELEKLPYLAWDRKSFYLFMQTLELGENLDIYERRTDEQIPAYLAFSLRQEKQVLLLPSSIENSDWEKISVLLTQMKRKQELYLSSQQDEKEEEKKQCLAVLARAYFLQLCVPKAKSYTSEEATKKDDKEGEYFRLYTYRFCVENILQFLEDCFFYQLQKNLYQRKVKTERDLKRCYLELFDLCFPYLHLTSQEEAEQNKLFSLQGAKDLFFSPKAYQQRIIGRLQGLCLWSHSLHKPSQLKEYLLHGLFSAYHPNFYAEVSKLYTSTFLDEKVLKSLVYQLAYYLYL